ncbi:hypothetical protein [Streptomyces sp. NPDC088746]|uniref:hypothetical protein n=1 Tax=Streptomyces sp. NPDC088746 TaxID=3365885 RepID=UPI00381BF47A
MEAVDDVAAGDHLGGGEVFEGLALGGVLGVDAAVDPDAEECLGLGRLDRAADVGAGVLPSVRASTWYESRTSRRGVAVYASGGTCRRTSTPPASG